MTIPDKGAVVVKFYMDTCPPCKTLKPILDEVKKETEGVDFIDIDVKKEQELAVKYGVKSVPMVIFIRDGKVETGLPGVHPKQTYIEEINLLVE